MKQLQVNALRLFIIECVLYSHTQSIFTSPFLSQSNYSAYYIALVMPLAQQFATND